MPAELLRRWKLYLMIWLVALSHTGHCHVLHAHCYSYCSSCKWRNGHGLLKSCISTWMIHGWQLGSNYSQLGPCMCLPHHAYNIWRVSSACEVLVWTTMQLQEDRGATHTVQQSIIEQVHMSDGLLCVHMTVLTLHASHACSDIRWVDNS